MTKKAFVTKAQVDELAMQFATPFHLYDEAGIRKTARDLYAAFAWNPGFKEYFAVKATPNPSILKILQEEGCGVDCASYVELLMSEKCDFSGTDIMFSSNDTPAEDFLYAKKLGAIINLDAFEDIDFLSKLPLDLRLQSHSESGHSSDEVVKMTELPETICLRYNPGGVFAMGNRVMNNPEESKFGMTKVQVFAGIEKLQKLGVRKFGLHAFLASNTLTNDYYPQLARQMFELALEIKQELGVNIDFIDLSGGIGVPYLPDEEANDIFKIAEGVHTAFDEVLTPNGLGEMKIFTELGRYMLAPHGLLVTKVLHKKKTYRNYLGVDASSVNLLRPAMYGAYHHITVLGKEDLPSTETYDVTGSLCENNDKLAVERQLPEVEVGDILLIHDTGAHGFSMGYQYNGRLRSAEILLKEDGTSEMIRRAEKPEDYFATVTGLNFSK